jgi:hypothetical protein
VLAQSHYLMGQITRAAEYLLILAHETTAGHHTHDPLWEFLRHCRNAAAHGGRFELRHGEPKRPATWRNLTITTGLAGTRLIDGPRRPTSAADDVEKGLLAVGDVVPLLWDIERNLLSRAKL